MGHRQRIGSLGRYLSTRQESPRPVSLPGERWICTWTSTGRWDSDLRLVPRWVPKGFGEVCRLLQPPYTSYLDPMSVTSGREHTRTRSQRGRHEVLLLEVEFPSSLDPGGVNGTGTHVHHIRLGVSPYSHCFVKSPCYSPLVNFNLKRTFQVVHVKPTTRGTTFSIN